MSQGYPARIYESRKPGILNEGSGTASVLRSSIGDPNTDIPVNGNRISSSGTMSKALQSGAENEEHGPIKPLQLPTRQKHIDFHAERPSFFII